MGLVFSAFILLTSLSCDKDTDISSTGFYLPTLLQEFVGYDQQMSRLISAASSTIYVGSSFACLLLIDRIGRRK